VAAKSCVAKVRSQQTVVKALEGEKIGTASEQ